MLNLLRSDFFKLRKSRAFYICILVGCVMMVISAFSTQSISKMLEKDPGLLDSLNMGTTSSESGKVGIGTDAGALTAKPSMESFLQSCLSDNTLQVVLAVFISIFIAAEFHHGTIKNLACRGQKRAHIYLSKLVTGSLAGAAMLLTVALMAALVGGILWGFTVGPDFWGHLLRMLGLELYLIIALVSLFTFITMTVRNTGGSIAINLCLLFFAGLVFQLFNLILGGDSALQNYWLITQFKEVNTFAVTGKAIVQALCVGGAYFAASTGLGILAFRKRDV